MASEISAAHRTQSSTSFPRARAAIICCDVCRKHVDMPSECGSLIADACHESPHHESTCIDVQKLDGGHFDCNICLDGCHDPVVTLCGHLFCWPCLYCWLSLHSLSQQLCPICKANVQGKIIPLYGHGKAEHSMKSAAMMFPDMHIPCRPLPSRSHVPAVATNTVSHHAGEPTHAIQDSEIHTSSARHAAAPSANVGLFASMLRCSITSLPSYGGGFFCGRQARNGASILAPPQRFSNEKEFILHWAFIFVASVAIVCFTVCN